MESAEESMAVVDSCRLQPDDPRLAGAPGCFQSDNHRGPGGGGQQADNLRGGGVFGYTNPILLSSPLLTSNHTLQVNKPGRSTR